MRVIDDLSPVQTSSAQTEAWRSLARLNAECCLTSRDYTLLEARLYQRAEEESGEHMLLLRLIRSKLTNARVVLSRDVELDVATGGSRIAFSVDGAPSIERVLAHWAEGRAPSDTLSTHSLLGATLLGMRAGKQSLVPRRDVPFGTVRLEGVVHQPEAARQGASREVTNG